MSEEIYELREHILAQNYDAALALVDEMEEMSLNDIKRKIRAYMRVLLAHRIKQAAEARTTRSWSNSMTTALENIADINKRDKAGGFYLNHDGLAAALRKIYPAALRWAAQEAFEGIHTDEQIAARIDREAILDAALADIIEAQREDS